MKLFRNPYFISMASAVLTAVFFAFVIIAISKFISRHFFATSSASRGAGSALSIPLYTAPEPTTTWESVLERNADEDIETGNTPLVSNASVNSNGESKPAPVSASAYIVIALSPATSSQSILASRAVLERNSEQALPIASLTKLATAVVAENVLDQNAPITITQQILSTYADDPGGLREGEQMTAAQLMYPLLMVSSNDAAEALAESYAPGKAWFVKAMNDWAYSIGAYNTYFADPTGLSPENISSAHDLAIMLGWIYIHRPELIAITDIKVKNLGSHTWTSPTQLLNLSSYLGGKNGYIPAAGQTSVSLFNVDSNKKYIIVTLNSLHRDQDIVSLLSKI